MSQKYWLSAAAITLPQVEIAELPEQQAWEVFVSLRWGDSGTQKCSWCGAVDHHSFIRPRKQWHCKACKRRFSVTTGTPFQNRKLPFRDILVGWHEFISGQQGKAALEIRRKIGSLTNEKTKIVAYVFGRHPPVLAGLEPGVLCNLYITAIDQ